VWHSVDVGTNPPGVGEQQVFAIWVVFSQEYTDGCDKQAEKSGKVLGTREKLRVSGTARTADTSSANTEKVDVDISDEMGSRQ
jgi:hypothetical protein